MIPLQSVALFEKKPSGQGSEMSFMGHLEALRWHIIRSVIVVCIAFVVLFINNDLLFGEIIFGPKHQNFITYRAVCALGYKLLGDNSACITVPDAPLINTELAGQFTMHLWVSFVGGLILAMPYILWELWRFVKPALKETETKPVRGFVAVSSMLFFIGVCFSYFLIFPLTWNFLVPYQASGTDIVNYISFDSYISNLTTLTLAFGLVFEMPIVVYFLSRLGIMTPKFMRKFRRHAVVVILILAAFITPTSDIPTQMAVAVPLYALYEISIFVSAFVTKKHYPNA